MKKLLPQNLPKVTLPVPLDKARRQVAKYLPKLPAQPPRKPAPQLPLDLTPFDRYRRRKLIEKLNLPELQARSVLEVGCGIGDLLLEIGKHKPKELYGVDNSPEAVATALRLLAEAELEADVSVSDGTVLPFPDKSFDVVYLMREFDLEPDDQQVEGIVREMCRVSRQWVILVEDTAEKLLKRDEQTLRTAPFFKELFLRQEGRFHLRKTEYLDVKVTRSVFTAKSNPWHWIRWLLSPLLYLLGFPKAWLNPPLAGGELPDSKFAMTLQKWVLPFAAGLDDVFTADHGITILRFEREKLFRR